MKRFKFLIIAMLAIVMVLAVTMQACSNILDATAAFVQSGDTNYFRKKCDHEFTTVVVEPTCTEDGYKKRICDKCGYEEVLENTTQPCNGHLYKEKDIVVVPPTCTEQGYTKRVCDICGHEEIEEGSYVAATGHTFATDYSFDETYHWHAATCGHDDAVTKAEHDFSEGDTCKVCGYHK